MGQDQRAMLKDYCSTLQQFYTAFYGNTMILTFLHFSDNKNEPDKRDETYE
jgi:hypothetical protein